MKINSSKENLMEGIQVIQASVSPRTTLPILHNFLMEAAESKIKLVRTDLELATTHYVNAEVVEPGSITVPAKEFSDILHTLSNDQEITITTDESNKVHIKSGKSKFWIMGAPKDEYPIIPDMEKENVVAVPAESVQRMIQKTIFAASAQETRYVLNGVQWVCGPKGFELVATDGRRLAVASQEAIAGAKDFKIIVPSKILNELTRFLNSEKPAEGATIDVGVSTNQIGFRINQTTFISRLIEGNFPNYEQVIPAKVDITFEADTKELLAVTRRAALCTSDRGGAVKYQMTAGTLMVSASSQKMEFNDEIHTEYSGNDFHVAFNPQYVIDVLKNISTDRVSFGLTNAVNPVLVEPVGEKGCRYVVMPVRS